MLKAALNVTRRPERVGQTSILYGGTTEALRPARIEHALPITKNRSYLFKLDELDDIRLPAR